jgi:hypothetical protein
MIGSAPSRRTLLGSIAGAGLLAMAAPARAAGAIKHYILVELLPGVDQLALDRWYMTYHAPEVRRAYQAWQRNYVSFRSYLPPEEARTRFGVGYGRMTEIHFDAIDDFRESRRNSLYGDNLESFTPPPGGWAKNRLFRSTTATISTNPDRLFLSQPTPPRDLPYLRWILFQRYPPGVAVDEGDAWFEAAHAPQLAALPGLRRFARYKVLGERSPFTRVTELWFDDYAQWRTAFLGPPPIFTPPPWGGDFPYSETKSMFIGERPDIDFIHDERVIP